MSICKAISFSTLLSPSYSSKSSKLLPSSTDNVIPTKNTSAVFPFLLGSVLSSAPSFYSGGNTLCHHGHLHSCCSYLWWYLSYHHSFLLTSSCDSLLPYVVECHSNLCPWTISRAFYFFPFLSAYKATFSMLGVVLSLYLAFKTSIYNCCIAFRVLLAAGIIWIACVATLYYSLHLTFLLPGLHPLMDMFESCIP